MTGTETKNILITVRCNCGKKLGEVFGFFKLKCDNKPRHGRKNVLVQGYTDQGQAVIEGVWPEIMP